MKSALEKKGVRVSGELVLNKSEILGNDKINDLITMVRTAAGSM
jgi:hypothetical protein